MEQLGKELKVPPVVAQLLLNRGVREPGQARLFLDAPMKGLHPPEALPGVSQAADRLIGAIRERKRICVYGDYDVDGTTGTAILWQMFHLLGGQVDFYVPHRLEEGYGLNMRGAASDRSGGHLGRRDGRLRHRQRRRGGRGAAAWAWS